MLFALLALLLGVQASNVAPEPIDGGPQVLRIVAAVPPAAQFRDTGKVVRVVSQVVTAKVRGDAHDSGPPLPARAVGLAVVHWDRQSPDISPRTSTRVGQPADRYRARAPPTVA